jgi:hypothetical protein
VAFPEGEVVLVPNEGIVLVKEKGLAVEGAWTVENRPSVGLEEDDGSLDEVVDCPIDIVGGERWTDNFQSFRVGTTVAMF